LGFLAPTDKIMSQIIALLYAKPDAKPLVKWNNFEIRRYQQELYFIDIKNNTKQKCLIQADFENSNNFAIRYRTQGQRVKLPNKHHSQSLKKVLQEANIPPWERTSLKMYYVDDKLIAMERIGFMQNSAKN
jgi:tRNA(Ile)-lysidine synthase